tara:strand:- start:19 stop:492 length:474 start_codon:yes stop_codon:yes gene_type:complete
MLFQFQEYLTLGNIYLWSNIGILPFWLMLLIIPRSRITQVLINSIILPLIFSSLYIYVIYQAILLDEPIYDLFKLYSNLDNLYTVFSSENFLLAFWLHFIALNLFLGLWIARDGVKYNIPYKLVFLPLAFAYFVGPVGLILYWFVRVFYSKRLGFHD